jgi:hypothetical protein
MGRGSGFRVMKIFGEHVWAFYEHLAFLAAGQLDIDVVDYFSYRTAGRPLVLQPEYDHRHRIGGSVPLHNTRFCMRVVQKSLSGCGSADVPQRQARN